MSLINTAVGLLAISSPIGVLPVVARAAGGDVSKLRRISRLAVLTFGITLLAACWWGQALLDLFGITLDSFRVAGGLILLPIGLRLIEGLEVGHPDVETDAGSLGLARQAQRWRCSWLDTVITARGGHNGFHSRDHIERLEGGNTVSWADRQTRAWLKGRLKDQFTGSRFGCGRPTSGADAHDLRRT